jgi:hypothetical protein
MHALQISWASLELALIDCGLRLTIRLIDQTGSASFAISERLRLKSTSFVAQFTTRSEDRSTVFSKSYRRLVASLCTSTKDAWPYTYRRPFVFALLFSSHIHILDQLPPNNSLPFLWCSQLGAPSNKWIEIIQGQ